MKTIKRREFLGVSFAGLACASLGGAAVERTAEETAQAVSLESLGLKIMGKVAARSSLSIKASPLSVGFEVLDRKRFDPARAYPHLAQLGVKWARCQTGWCRCEPEKGKYDFGWLDEVVDNLLKIGIQPWFNLGYGNRLYTPDAPDEAAVGWVPVFDESVMQAWLRFTRAIAEHFSGRVRHWEIWNEPNAKSFWQPRAANPADYVKLVAQTAPVIREAVPDAVIIGLALAGTKLDFMEGALEAGLAEHVDVISYHPYQAVPEEGYEATVARIREMIAARRAGVEIWQGENGCPSRGGEGSVGALSRLDWSEVAQAKWLLRRILTDLRLDVALTSYYHSVDLVNYRGGTNFKGLLRGTDYTPKPAYYAYQCLCALFDAETKRVVLSPELLSGKKSHLQEAEFVRNGHALYAFWFPAELLKPWAPREIAVRLSFPDNVTINEPVLIDPLSGQAYAHNGFAIEKKGLLAERLPLLDYPLVIADRSVLGEGA